MTANAAMAVRALNVFMKAQAPPFAAAGRERDGRAAKRSRKWTDTKTAKRRPSSVANQWPLIHYGTVPSRGSALTASHRDRPFL